jgi:hypothetical protein
MSASASPAAAEIDFTIRAAPAQAKIFVDGQPMPTNPASGRRARDGAIHVVRVEAPGFESREEQLAFDRSVFVTLELHAAAASQATATGASATPANAMNVPNVNKGRGVGGASFRPPPPRSPPGNRGAGGAGGLDTENPYP